MCYQYLLTQNNISWRWIGEEPDNFYQFCAKSLVVDQGQYTGLVIINYSSQQTVSNYITTIKSMISQDVEHAYLAINRYDFAPGNDTGIEFPDQLSDTVDLIAAQCDPRFKRLYSALAVDGKHFVGAHGLDVYVF